MADKFINDFFLNSTNWKIHYAGRIGGSTHSHLPFKEIEEKQLALIVMQMQQENLIINQDVFKDVAIKFAAEQNIWWDHQNYYDEWYSGFLTRNPFAYTVLHFEENPLILHARKVYHYWDAKRKSERPKFMDVDNDDENDDIIDVNGKEELIFRPKNDGEVLYALYHNWLYNYRGYPQGLVVGYATISTGLMHTSHRLIERNVGKFNGTTTSGTGCSFDQELADGLRIHAKDVKRIGHFATEAGAKELKFIYRRTLHANSAHDPLPKVTISPANERRIIRKLQKQFAAMDDPFNGEPMKIFVKSLKIMFEECYDPDVIYLLSDVYAFYEKWCTQNGFDAVNGMSFGTFLKNQFPNRKKTPYNLQNNNYVMIQFVKGRTGSIQEISPDLKHSYITSAQFRRYVYPN